MKTPAYIRAINLAAYGLTKIEEGEFYVASNPVQRVAGLAGLAGLDKAGMVFVYDEPANTPFSMSNMEFDLTIAFYDAEGTMLRQGTFSAGFDGPVFCRGYSYVLETPAGRSVPEKLDVGAMEKQAVKPGTHIPAAPKDMPHGTVPPVAKVVKPGPSNMKADVMPTDIPDVTSCPECGAVIPLDLTTCPECGYDLNCMGYGGTVAHAE